jgi:hypothetical protein
MRKFLICAFVLVFCRPVLAEEQKLSQAYEQQLIHQVQSVFSPTAMVELQHPICATPIFLDMKAKWDRLSAGAKQVLQPYNERPSFSEPEQTYDTPSGHFKIHFVTEGADAVFEPTVDQNHNGYPDWVDAAGDILDYVWNKEVNGLSYRQPPSDGGYPGDYDNGGDGRYDIYLLNISSQFLGYTEPEFYVSGSSGPATSYMVLDNDYLDVAPLHTQIQWMQVTAAHEFFHAIQMGYDGAEYEVVGDDIKPYWMEMSAVWMEDMAYDEVNDYVNYLSSFFDNPQWSLKTYDSKVPEEALHAYASCVWPIFLQESFQDTVIIRRIWEACGDVPGDNAFNPTGGSATDIVLESRGSSFDEAFKEFTAWNYFTGSRARPDSFYSEGNLFVYEVVVEKTHQPTDYPVYSPSGPFNPYGLGSNYIVFKHQELQGGLHLEFSPAAGGNFQITVIGYNEGANQPIFPHVQSNSQTGAAECNVYNWTSYNDIVLIAAAADRDGDANFAYTYAAEYDSSLHGDEPFPQYVWIGQNFPNPFVITGSNDSTYFPFILSSVTEVEIGIFSVSGELVWQYPPPGTKAREWTIGEYTQRGQCPAWDGRNQNGEYVASGVYIYRVKTKSSTVVKKLAVIR